MARSFHPTEVLTASVVIFSLAGTTFAAPQYTIVQLGNLGGPSLAMGLNNSGEVVGSAILPNGDSHAFLWTQSTGMQDLGTLPGDSQGSAVSINNLGQVVGYSQPAGENPPTHAFLWQSSTGMTNISAATGTAASGFNINDQGQIAGQIYTGQFYENGSGYIYSATTGITPITISGTPTYDVRAINNRGQMVIDGPQNTNSLLYVSGQSPIEIQGTTGAAVQGLAINDQGTVIGYMNGPNGGPVGSGNYTHAFLWNQATGLTDLTPGPYVQASANGINALGEVVGTTGSELSVEFSPFLYEDGTLFDLTTLLGSSAAGWSNLNPSGINDNGQIVGFGMFGGMQQAFILNPNTSAASSIAAPEPASFAILSVAIACLARRRRFN